MQYIKIDNNTWVEINGELTRMVRKDVLQAEIEACEAYLEANPQLSDDEFLAWAKDNHPSISDNAGRIDYLGKLQTLLTQLK